MDSAPNREVTSAAFKDVMGRFPTGVAVVTAVEAGQPVGFTCQSFVSLSLLPPFVALAPAKSSTSWPRIVQAGCFCVNVLSDHQGETARRFSQQGIDRFSETPWSLAPNGSPRLDEVVAWVECAVQLVHDAGDHELVIGRVLDLGTGAGSPLIFYQGTYRGVDSSTR
jgi:3-hydroxy-9,10-secoandrosta-1,3,5(10)-triene-9,17-dione monooxygenase reductase component